MIIQCDKCGSKMHRHGKNITKKGIAYRWKCPNCGMYKTLYDSHKETVLVDDSNIKKEIDEYNKKNINEMIIKDGLLHINYVGKEIKTVDDLLKQRNINKDDFIIRKEIVKSWSTPMKMGTGEGVIFVTNNYAAAELTPKVLKNSEFEPLKPIKISGDIKVSRNTKTGVKKALIIPDAQIGFRKQFGTNNLQSFHDRKAIDIVLQVCSREQFDKIVLLGDFLDMQDFSTHYVRMPEFVDTTQPSLIEATWLLYYIRQLQPTAEIVFLEGNHEKRVYNAYLENLQSAYNVRNIEIMKGMIQESKHPILSVSHLMGLDVLNVEYIGDYPKSEYWINDNLKCEHGNTLRPNTLLNEINYSLILGHGHKSYTLTKTIHKRDQVKIYSVHSPGTLSKIDGTVPSKNAKDKWQQGFTIVNYVDGNGFFNMHNYLIFGGTCVYGDKIIIGEDYLDKMKENVDTNYVFD